MSARRGLLLTMTEPPPGMEDEFNAWYDTEHLPERLGIPGFRSARRWEADLAPGQGRYLATYEVDSLDVLKSAPYLARFENPTPWSRRCLGRAVVFKRWACEQLQPGEADPHPDARWLVFATGDVPARLGGILQVRRFAASGDARPLVLCELRERPSGRIANGIAYRAYEAA